MERSRDRDERRPIARLPARAALAAIRAYKRWISPWLGSHCRFYPTCSEYAMDVIASHGLMRGGWLAVRRLLKCHPFHPGGEDLPPRPPSR